MQTKWNLKLLYKSHTDPKIEKDLLSAEKAYSDFADKYKDGDFVNDENSLFLALEDYNQLVDNSSAATHAYIYFHCARDLNAHDQKAEAEINKITERLAKATNKIIFFELLIGKIAEEKQKEYLSSNKLENYRYFLEKIFKQAKYMLSEGEEKIISLKSLPAHSLWTDGFEKLLNKQTVLWKKEELPIPKALSTIATLPVADRYKLHKLCFEKFKSVSDFAEAEVNAVVINHKINDELRGFKNPYDSTLLSYETDESMVDALVKAVTDAKKISHRFYKLKAKLLKLERLTYADRGVGIGKTDKEITFEEGVKIVKKAYRAMDKDFEKIFDDYLKNGQIDVYPKKGKAGGAYCYPNTNTPTFVMLNHISNMKSVTTLAHEMGHAIHSEYSKKQSPIYEGYTIAVAEVASTFFEEVVFDNIFETLSEKEKIVALHDKINDSISTIFRQIACFNFEKELHLEIRSKGTLPKEEIAKLMNKHMKAYLGPVFDLTELDGYFFVNWSHIRRFFYVYSYAFGELVSKALYHKYKKDPTYLKEIKQFLSAGNSKSPKDIFKDIGIDTSDPKFWEEGLASIEEDIKRLEKLTK